MEKNKIFEFGPLLKKLWAKNRNSISFKPVNKKISKFTRNGFLIGTKKCQKWRKSKIKISQNVRFGVSPNITHHIYRVSFLSETFLLRGLLLASSNSRSFHRPYPSPLDPPPNKFIPPNLYMSSKLSPLHLTLTTLRILWIRVED